MSRTFTVVEINTPDRANGSNPIPPHELPANMVRVFVGRDVPLKVALAALDQVKRKLASGERITTMPSMTNKTPQ